jgi:hypothetical protein
MGRQPLRGTKDERRMKNDKCKMTNSASEFCLLTPEFSLSANDEQE